MAKNNKFKLLIENIFAYGFANVLNKIIPLIAMPIITRLLTDTAEYGVYDMFNTIVQLGDSLVLLGMYDAFFREYFEKDNVEYQRKTASTAFAVVFCSALFWTLIFIGFKGLVSKIFLGTTYHQEIVILGSIGCFFTAIRTILLAPIRVENRRTLYISLNFISAVLFYLIGIILINNGWSYMGMIVANLISVVIMCIVLLPFSNGMINFKEFDWKIAKVLFRIGLPTIPGVISTWIFTSMDKIMITNMVGLSAVGVYSAGAKIAATANIVLSTFTAGWHYFAFKTMYEKNQVEFTTRIQRCLVLASCILFSLAIILYKPFFGIYYSGDYIHGELVFPYLFLSPLILMIYMVCDSQFMVEKKSELCTACLMIGAMANLGTNYVFIKLLGMQGAAIGTLVGYVISLIVALLICYRHQLLDKDRKIWLGVGSLIILSIISGFLSVVITILCAAILMVGAIIIYKSDLKYILSAFKSMLIKNT